MNVKLQRPHFSQPVKATKAAMLARIGELEEQLASEKQQHQIMDAAYWAAKEQLVEEQDERRRWQKNCERETYRVVELLEERGRLIMAAEDKDAALGALADALKDLMNLAEPHFSDSIQILALNRAEEALAPDAVQKAVEAAKAKDTEIERLKERAKDHAELHLKHLEAEAKLAVATELLQDSTEAMAEWRKYRERPGLPSFNRQEANMWAAQQKADAFLKIRAEEVKHVSG